MKQVSSTGAKSPKHLSRKVLNSDLLVNRMQDKATERCRTNSTSSEGNAVLRRVISKPPECFRRLRPYPSLSKTFGKFWKRGCGDENITEEKLIKGNK